MTILGNDGSLHLSGAERIAGERWRQIEIEGYTHDSDLQYADTELLYAALCYAVPPNERHMIQDKDGRRPVGFPWKPEFWKPTPDDRVRELEKAGALIAAEIDRLVGLKEKE